MKIIATTTLTSLVAVAFAFASMPAQADLLGTAVDNATNAVFESTASQVTASKVMNTAEEVKVVAPTTDAEATVSITAFDDSSDTAKDKAVAALEKASAYVDLANSSSVAADKTKYTTAATNYQKSAYFYQVAADLYLSAEQKVATVAAKLPDKPTSEDSAANVATKSLADAKMATTEAKAALALQQNANQAVVEATSATLDLGSTQSADQVAANISSLGGSVTSNKVTYADLSANYMAKAAATSGATKTAYLAAANTYSQASTLTDNITAGATTASARFSNAVPENPANPGENLKWHIFQSDPDTALAVMKYNFSLLAFSAVRWNTQAAYVANDPAGYLSSLDLGSSLSSYIDNFRTSSLQVSSESANLLTLVGQYNAQIPNATPENAAKWQLVSSYLVDIIATYTETAQAQNEIYNQLSIASGSTVAKAALVTQSSEVKTVLKAGSKVVAPAGELDASTKAGVTSIEVYTTKPQDKVTITLSKAGAKTVTVTDVSDDSGLATATVNKSYAGYTATVTLDGKVIDKETVAVTK